jgi:hypothetical protein
MLKLLAIGLLGSTMTIGGIWLNQYMAHRNEAEKSAAVDEKSPQQLKTEITGIPVVEEGKVTGYLIFQISSTIDVSKLPTRDFNVLPYLLDAGIRASYMNTGDGNLKFDAIFLKKLCEKIQKEANLNLASEAVLAVNLEQFNFVPKADIRGTIFSSDGH